MRKRVMNRIQEISNALSMATPSIVLLLAESRANDANASKLLLACTLLHLPVGAGYHLGCALGCFADPRHNWARRLDQTLQHAMACVFAYCLSGGSLAFALLNVIPNAIWAAQIWMQPRRTRCWIYVGLSTALYTLPMLVRSRRFYYAMAVGSMAAGGCAAFVPAINMGILGGWGHTLFHLMLGPYAHALAMACGTRGGGAADRFGI